jgi:hypothetical protein
MEPELRQKPTNKPSQTGNGSMNSDQLAANIQQLLDQNNIVEPAWTLKTPVVPSQKSIAETLWKAYKGYRARVRTTLMKSGLLDDPDKPKKLNEAIDFKGTCTEMCPTFEKVTRIMESDVMGPEKVRAFDGELYPDPDKMVKKLARSAAGQDAPLPSDVRSPAALRRTLDYLLKDLFQGTGEDLKTIHEFLWDRTRAIRRDFVFQQYSMEPHELLDEVYCLEALTRFHVISLHQLSNPESTYELFSEQQEREQLGKALLSLIHAYEDCASQGISCPNESEFRAYYILYNAHDPASMETIQDWPRDHDEDPDVQLAISMVESMRTVWAYNGPLKPLAPTDIAPNFFNQFFEIVRGKSVTYPMACFAEISFNGVRKSILKTIITAYRKQRDQTKDWNIDELRACLHLESPSEVVPFCQQYGLSFENTDVGICLSFPPDDDLDEPISQSQYYSRVTVEEKRQSSLSDAMFHTYRLESQHIIDVETESDDEDDLGDDGDQAMKDLWKLNGHTNNLAMATDDDTISTKSELISVVGDGMSQVSEQQPSLFVRDPRNEAWLAEDRARMKKKDARERAEWPFTLPDGNDPDLASGFRNPHAGNASLSPPPDKRPKIGGFIDNMDSPDPDEIVITSQSATSSMKFFPKENKSQNGTLLSRGGRALTTPIARENTYALASLNDGTMSKSFRALNVSNSQGEETRSSTDKKNLDHVPDYSKSIKWQAKGALVSSSPSSPQMDQPKAIFSGFKASSHLAQAKGLFSRSSPSMFYLEEASFPSSDTASPQMGQTQSTFGKVKPPSAQSQPTPQGGAKKLKRRASWQPDDGTASHMKQGLFKPAKLKGKTAFRVEQSPSLPVEMASAVPLNRARTNSISILNCPLNLNLESLDTAKWSVDYRESAPQVDMDDRSLIRESSPERAVFSSMKQKPKAYIRKSVTYEDAINLDDDMPDAEPVVEPSFKGKLCLPSWVPDDGSVPRSRVKSAQSRRVEMTDAAPVVNERSSLQVEMRGWSSSLELSSQRPQRAFQATINVSGSQKSQTQVDNPVDDNESNSWSSLGDEFMAEITYAPLRNSTSSTKESKSFEDYSWPSIAPSFSPNILLGASSPTSVIGKHMEASLSSLGTSFTPYTPVFARSSFRPLSKFLPGSPTKEVKKEEIANWTCVIDNPHYPKSTPEVSTNLAASTTSLASTPLFSFGKATSNPPTSMTQADGLESTRFTHTDSPATSVPSLDSYSMQNPSIATTSHTAIASVPVTTSGPAFGNYAVQKPDVAPITSAFNATTAILSSGIPIGNDAVQKPETAAITAPLNATAPIATTGLTFGNFTVQRPEMPASAPLPNVGLSFGNYTIQKPETAPTTDTTAPVTNSGLTFGGYTAQKPKTVVATLPHHDITPAATSNLEFGGHTVQTTEMPVLAPLFTSEPPRSTPSIMDQSKHAARPPLKGILKRPKHYIPTNKADGSVSSTNTAVQADDPTLEARLEAEREKRREEKRYNDDCMKADLHRRCHILLKYGLKWVQFYSRRASIRRGKQKRALAKAYELQRREQIAAQRAKEEKRDAEENELAQLSNKRKSPELDDMLKTPDGRANEAKMCKYAQQSMDTRDRVTTTPESLSPWPRKRKEIQDTEEMQASTRSMDEVHHQVKMRRTNQNHERTERILSTPRTEQQPRFLVAKARAKEEAITAGRRRSLESSQISSFSGSRRPNQLSVSQMNARLQNAPIPENWERRQPVNNTRSSYFKLLARGITTLPNGTPYPTAAVGFLPREMTGQSHGLDYGSRDTATPDREGSLSPPHPPLRVSLIGQRPPPKSYNHPALQTPKYGTREADSMVANAYRIMHEDNLKKVAEDKEKQAEKSRAQQQENDSLRAKMRNLGNDLVADTEFMRKQRESMSFSPETSGTNAYASTSSQEAPRPKRTATDLKQANRGQNQPKTSRDVEIIDLSD